MRTVRKLVLGETWTLPIAAGAAIGLTALVHVVAGGWWRSGGGFVLLALVVLAYVAATWTRRARRPTATAAPVLAESEPAGAGRPTAIAASARAESEPAGESA